MAYIFDLDISMGLKYIFQYDYIDEIKKILKGSDYRLYFVLLSDKIVLDCFNNVNNYLIVKCLNVSKKEQYLIKFDILGRMKVDNFDQLEINITDNGNILECSYNEKGLDYLKDYYPNDFKFCHDRILSNGSFKMQFHAKYLLQDWNFRNSEKNFIEYRVLYIGQSKQSNIFDRIENHSTIQKIHRELGKKYLGKSIEIMLCDVNCKALDRNIIEKLNSEIVMSSSLGRSFLLFDKISRNEVIDISEAILIAHFQPEFNNYLKKIDSKLKTYSKFNEIEIGSVNFSLDLYWDQYKEKSILFTDSMRTQTFSRILTYDYAKENENSLSYYDLDDEYY